MKKFAAMVVVGAFGAAVLALALIGSASAHAPYDSSTPAKGAVVATPPTSVVINFQEDIQKTAGSFGVTVTKDVGGSVTSGTATASGDAQLSVPLQSGLTAGRYVVNWNNTAADDGDPLAGAFSFYISDQPTAAQLAADQQLASIESNTLATATAEAAEAATSPTSVAAASAAGTTPRAATSPAATSNLPRTGTGPTGGANYDWLVIAAAVAIALTGAALVTASVRHSRSY
jgi:methionine-rich copper-binding protein CopC